MKRLDVSDCHHTITALRSAVDHFHSVSASASSCDHPYMDDLAGDLQAVIHEANANLRDTLMDLVEPVWPLLSTEVRERCRDAGVDPSMSPQSDDASQGDG